MEQVQDNGLCGGAISVNGDWAYQWAMANSDPPYRIDTLQPLLTKNYIYIHLFSETPLEVKPLVIHAHNGSNDVKSPKVVHFGG